MLRQALRELRFHPSRFVATAVAIAISVAFMAGSSVLVATEQGAYARLQSLPIAGADAVVEAPATNEDEFTDNRRQQAVAAALAGIDQVAAFEPSLAVGDALTHDRTSVVFNLIGLPSQALRWSSLQSGRWPSAPGEVVLSRAGADALGVEVGGSVTTSEEIAEYTVVGISVEPRSLFLQVGYLWPGQVGKITGLDPALGMGTWLVKAAPGVSAAALVSALNDQLAPLGGVTVQSADQAREAGLEILTAGFDAFRYLLWAFAAIAAVVGMITIANTFTILLAQRRRQIGLLRAVGAGGRQLRRRFLIEAVLLGILGSVLGIALGTGLAAIGATITGSIFAGLSLPVGELGFAFAVGLVITVVAAYVPVQRGTRAHPLEALQPEPTSEERRRNSRVRMVVCGLLAALGLAVSLFGLRLDNPLIPAIGGSVLLATGVLFGAPLYVPALLRGLAGLIASLGVTPRLAGLNAGRNPRRASTTATALMLAVGLIVTLQVGTATVRAALLDHIDRTYPVDIAVSASDYESTIPADLVRKLTAVPGVGAAVALDVAQVDLVRGTEEWSGVAAFGFDPAIAEVTRSLPAAVGDDQALLTADTDTAADNLPVTVRGVAGSAELAVVRSKLVNPWELMVSSATLDRLGGVVPDAVVWLSVPDRSRAASVVGAVNSLVDSEYLVSGGLATAVAQAEVLDLLLLVTTALLAVAVLIALVGVSNTLGLSVLERTRESALMRALGLQARSLRVMLLIEALMQAAVGVVVGIAFGSYFGWLGAQALASEVGAGLRFAVDLPRTSGMVVIVALAAALASVLPGRRAAMATPVEALAEI